MNKRFVERAKKYAEKQARRSGTPSWQRAETWLDSSSQDNDLKDLPKALCAPYARIELSPRHRFNRPLMAGNAGACGPPSAGSGLVTCW